MGLFSKKENTIPDFNVTKRVGGFVEFDDDRKKWLIPDKKKAPQVYAYGDILDCDLLEDEDSLTSGGLGRALAGGVIFGGVGAIVGGITAKRSLSGSIETAQSGQTPCPPSNYVRCPIYLRTLPG